MGALRRFLSGLSIDGLMRDVAIAERAAITAAEAGRSLFAEVVRLVDEIASLRNEVGALEKAVAEYPTAAEIRVELSNLHGQLRPIRERIAAIDAELGEIEQQVVARCRILATTVYRTYLDKIAARQFDVVVVDEASMLMPPLVFYAAGLAKLSMTVAGDFRQLPPIVTSDGRLAEEWLRQDVFQKAGIPRHVERHDPTPHLVALGTQYRMRSPICALINKLFYPENPLRSDQSVDLDVDNFPVAAGPLSYVDTAPYHPWTALRVGSYSRYNLFHALLVRNIVLHLDETGYLYSQGPSSAVGAIAPYDSQARLIQALLDDRIGARAAGIAATVHRFQGNEKPAIIIDLTDSLGAPLGRFLQATHRNEEGARLLNVALSRAKRHIVLVGNLDYLRARAPTGGFVQHLLDHFTEHGEALDLDALVPLAERDWIDGIHRVLPAGFDLPANAAGVFTEGTFYPAFLMDLERAKESIVIFSPYATRAGTGRWMDPIRAAIARGAKVRILTRPPDEPGAEQADEVGELIRGMRALGVVVDLRARMHEKIAILDDRVLWHGSLNVLSHRDTHESMLRIESPVACRQVGRFVSVPSAASDAPSLHTPENPACPVCVGPTIWREGRYGVYFVCEEPTCPGKTDTRRRGRGPGQRVRHSVSKSPRGRAGRPNAPCPRAGCNGRLAERRGRFGGFLGCTNYPTCSYTEDFA
jgi:hypothetical protein